MQLAPMTPQFARICSMAGARSIAPLSNQPQPSSDIGDVGFGSSRVDQGHPTDISI
jgi:hypothetical protein